MKALVMCSFALLFGMNCIAQSNNSLSSVFVFFKSKPKSNYFFKKDSVSLLQKRDTASVQKAHAQSCVIRSANAQNAELKVAIKEAEVNFSNVREFITWTAYQYALPGISIK